MVPSKAQRITGWILSILVAGFLIFSASFKLTEGPDRAEMFGKLGFTVPLMFKIGILEVTLAVLYLIPQTSFLAAILLTGYLGGATVTHLRIGEPFFPPVIMGIVMWFGCALRRPRILWLTIGKGE